MAELTLVIGNKNFSSWSLRPWLLLKMLSIDFDEVRIALFTADSKAAISQHSPSGKVPVLKHGNVTVWDSLAICEYIAESHPKAWPQEVRARCVARSVSAEMHSGFPAVRQELPMNCRLQLDDYPLSEDVQNELQRLEAIWTDCRREFGAEGPFLFGRFSIADAMYAPMAIRCYSYAVDLGAEAAAYRDTLLALEPMREWMAAAEEEYSSIERNET